MTLWLFVKGNKLEVEKATSLRGLPFAFDHEGRTETVGFTSDEHEASVRNWFNETPYGTAPYPVGTLLFWSQS